MVSTWGFRSYFSFFFRNSGDDKNIPLHTYILSVFHVLVGCNASFMCRINSGDEKYVLFYTDTFFPLVF